MGELASGAGAQPQWTILACLDTRCGLSQAADGYQERLRVACRKLGLPLTVQRISAPAADPRHVSESLLMLAPGGWRPGRVGGIDSVPAAVGRAAGEAFAARPASHTMLLIVGHGTGLLEADETLGMEATDLGQALQTVAERLGKPLDVLGLDTCFGASLEKLWELRDRVRYVTAAPGLVYAPGLRWDEALAGAAGSEPRALSAQVAELGMTGGTLDAALVSIEVARLPAVVEELRGLTDQLVLQLPRQGHALTYARSRARSWGKRQELCDLGSLAAHLQADGAEAELAAQAARVRQALADSIIGRWWGEGRPADGSVGMGVYFPRTYETIPESYQRLPWAGASHWYHFLDLYWAWVSSLIGGGAHPR